MPSSSGHGPRPTSPVEEDLQKLYNEVWAVFADETPASERDLENIYNGYADDHDPTPPSLVPPPSQTQRSPSPYRVNTQNIATTPSPASSKSPTRRRLPPTPGGSSSSMSPQIPSYSMPEPEAYYPPGASRPHLYNTNNLSSYTSHASSSTPNSDMASGSSRRTSDTNGRHAVGVHGYSNDISPWDDGVKTPVSDYQTHHPSSPRNDIYQRPPGAQPPALPPKPSAYISMGQNPYLSASSSSAYDPDGRDAYTYLPPSDPYLSTAPKPPLPSNPSVNNEQYLSYTPQKAYPPSSQTSSSYGEFSDPKLHNPAGDASQSGFFDPPPAPLSARLTQQVPSLAVHDANGYDNYGEQHGYEDDDALTASDPNVVRRPSDMLRTLADFSPSKQRSLELRDADDPLEEYWEDEDEEDETRFVNFSLLSNIAMQLRDKIPRGTHVKGSIPYPRAFTGKDIVSTIQTQIQRELAINHGVSTNDRRVALQVARSLQSQLFFYEVEWGNRVLQDGVEDVYMFLDDQESGSDAIPEREELPTSVITMLTRCYSPSCGEGVVCYAFSCPRKGDNAFVAPSAPIESVVITTEEAWTSTVDEAVVQSLPKSEVNRQNIIHQLINREKQYLQDLDLVESAFIKPLRAANPPVLAPHLLEDFIDDVFGNILDLRETNRRLLEVLYVRQREEGPIILRIGDIFLQAAAEFRLAYPTYIGHFPISEKRLKEETEANPQLKLFLDQCARQPSSRSEDTTRLELKSFLSRPADHLQRYTVHLETVLHETAPENPDVEFLAEAIEAIKNLHAISQLRTFQAAMGKGAPGKWEWHDIVPAEVREHFTKKEAKRQAIIFELIKGEMAYVKDLENIQNMYIIPLRRANPPIITSERLDQFIDDVFHNYAELFQHHKKLVDSLHEIQREQHPNIRTITAPLFDAALNFRDAYMEYIPNYPIAAYRIDNEMANNPAFKTFVDACVRHPDAHRLDMKNFINRPIPRLLRYELLLKGIMDETPEGQDDLESIPHVVEVIKALGKETEPGVQSAKQKVEVWRYNAQLIFKGGESVDMDLLDPNRSLIYSGKLLRQPEGNLEWSSAWGELQVLLFDNYLVMTKPKEKDNVTKYQVHRRPIPLDLLTLVNFTDPPTLRGAGLLRNLRGGERHDSNNSGVTPDSATDSRSVFPLTLHHNGRTGGPYILYAESAQSRLEWKEKLEHALVLRKTVQESNKVFEVEYLSRETFVMPALAVTASNGPAWNQDSQFTGKVTCSVPFNTPDGRALVAIGCTEGVWIGFRHDPKSIRRVLHLKMVTQCAMLEDFGIFLVLADKALFAYHIEALVPSSPHGAHTSQVPQKLSGTKDVHFFSVGTLQNRTLIIYMKKKSLNSIFRVLEPVGDKINEGVKAPAGFGSRLGFRSTKSEWFRIYRDFFLPSDSFDVIFLKARIAIFCAKGFEIMNLHDFDSITIPQREDPRHAQLAKRCEASRPLGMFRSTEEEFLLCYDEFGLYVDKHGDPCRQMNTIEWEGTAERVAFHAPYILLFDSRFIEIRHIATGRLAQIIPGNEIRCTWDGRGVSITPNTPPVGIDDEDGNQEAQVHFVMNSTDSVSGPGGMRSRNIVQHVCELIPTVSLFPSSGTAQGAGSVMSAGSGGGMGMGMGMGQAPPAPPPKGQGYDPYSATHAPQTHMSTYSYASTTGSPAQGYAAHMGGVPGQGQQGGYAPALPTVVPPNLGPVPGGGTYYNRAGQSTMSPELRTSQTWR